MIIRAICEVINDKDWVRDVFRDKPAASFAWSLLIKFYCSTWFSQDYISGVVKTSFGCMAGTPPADIIYALAFARVRFKRNSCLKDKGLESILDAHRHAASLAASDVDYCDDTVFPVVVSAGELVRRQSHRCCL